MSDPQLRPLTINDALAIAAWRYPPPYDFYDPQPGELFETDGVYAADEDGVFVGYASFGDDARVPGGDYPEGPLDIGMGLRPDRLGAGLGTRVLALAIELARTELAARSFRVTIADWNTRALALCERAGFVRVTRFDGPRCGFAILLRSG